MKKFDLRSFLRSELDSIVMIIFGAILLLNPDFGSAAISGILGWCLVGVGALFLLVCMLSKPRLTGGAVMGAIILILGIYLLDHPLMLAKIFGIALGLMLLRQGLQNWVAAKKVQQAGGMYVSALLFSCCTTAIGFALILSPLSSSRLFMTLGGAILVALGIGNIVTHYRTRGYLEDRNYDPNIIDADP